MFKKRTLLIPLFLATAALASCGGGGDVGDAATGQVEDAAATAADAATDVASDATDAVADTASAVGDAIDPAAWQDITTNWDSQISSVQETFPDLSVDEITDTAGNPESLVSLVEQKYGISREEAQTRVTDWVSSL